MSQENVEIVRRLYRAMNARDLEALAELVHPDAEWIHDSRVGQGPVRGRESVIQFFTDQAEMFDELRAEPESFWETDDKVLVFVRVTGRGKASGAPVDIRIGHLLTVRDGAVVRGEGYGDRDSALRKFSPEVEVHDPPEMPDAAIYRGHKAVVGGWQRMFDSFEEFSIQIEQYQDLGDELLVLLRYRGRGRGSGIPVEMPMAHLVSIRNGKLVRLRQFMDREAVLEAAGLRE